MCLTAAGHQGEGKCRGRPDVLYSSHGFLILNAVILVQTKSITKSISELICKTLKNMAQYSPKNAKEKTLKVSNSFGTAYTPTTKAAGSQHARTHTYRRTRRYNAVAARW